MFYIGLYRIIPTGNDDIGVEINDTNYKRVPIDKWISKKNGILYNNEYIEFKSFKKPTKIAGFGIFTNEIDSHYFAMGSLTNVILLKKGDSAAFQIKSIKLQIT